MTVKKVTVMRDDCLRKTERLECRFGLLVVLLKRCKEESSDRRNWLGMFAHWGDSRDLVQRLKMVNLQLGSRVIDPPSFMNKWQSHDLRYLPYRALPLNRY